MVQANFEIVKEFNPVLIFTIVWGEDPGVARRGHRGAVPPGHLATSGAFEPEGWRRPAAWRVSERGCVGPADVGAPRNAKRASGADRGSRAGSLPRLWRTEPPVPGQIYRHWVGWYMIAA